MIQMRSDLGSSWIFFRVGSFSEDFLLAFQQDCHSLKARPEGSSVREGTILAGDVEAFQARRTLQRSILRL